MKKGFLKLVGLVFVLCIIFSFDAYAEDYEYDKLDRITKVTYEDGSYVTYEYDANGNITKTTVHEVSEDTSEEGSEETSEEESSSEDSSTEEPSEDATEETTENPQEPDYEGKEFVVESVSETLYYTGDKIKPEVTVFDVYTEEFLVNGKDYSVSYKNNKSVYTLKQGESGFDAKKAPTIIIKGKNNFSNQITIYFTIQPKDFSDLSDKTIEVEDLLTKENGKKQKKTPTIMYNGRKISLSEFVVSYPAEGEDAYKKAGSYPVVITGKKNFSGTRTINLIVASKGTSLAEVTINKIPIQKFDGINAVVLDENTLVVTMKKNGKKETLIAGKHYNTEYRNNDGVGTATLTIRAIEGSGFVGFKKTTFAISGISISKAKIEGNRSYTYTGWPQEPEFQVKLEETLTKGKDYLVTYSKNEKVGKAAVVIEGIGKYTGKRKITFNIVPADLTELVTFENGEVSVKYVKGGSKPEVNLSFNGKELVSGKDYLLTYKNNKSVYELVEGDSGYNIKKAPTVTIKGKGNFKGKADRTFTIQRRGLADEEVGVRITVADKVETKKAGGYISKVTVTDANGKVLTQGKEYSKPVYLTVNSDGKEVVLGKEDILPAGNIVTIRIEGLGLYAGAEDNVLFKTYRITEKDFSKANVKSIKKMLKGTSVELTEADFYDEEGKSKVTVGKGKNQTELIFGRDFEIVPDSYTKNNIRGTASVKIRGLNEYGGIKTIRFKITSRNLK